MSLGYSGGDFLYNGPLTNIAQSNSNGVFRGFASSISGGTVIQVGSGQMEYYSKRFESAGAFLDLPVGSTVPRIDLIYATGNAVSFRSGAYPNSNEKPNPPQVMNGELALYYVTVPSGASTVGASNIRDLRTDANLNPLFGEVTGRFFESTYLSGARPAGYPAPTQPTRYVADFFNNTTNTATSRLANTVVNINGAGSSGVPKVFATNVIDSFPFTSGTTTGSWASGAVLAATSGTATVTFTHDQIMSINATANGTDTNNAYGWITNTHNLRTGSVINAYFYYSMSAYGHPSYPSYGWAGMGLSDDAGNKVYLRTLTASATGAISESGLCRLRIYPGSQTTDLYLNGVLTTTGINLASLAQYRIHAAGSGQTSYHPLILTGYGEVSFNFLSYNNAPVSGTWYSTVRSTSSVGNATHAYFKTQEYQTESGTITHQISVDSGATYYDISGGQWIKFPTAGSSVVLRSTITATGSEISPSLNEVAVLYSELEL